MEDEHLGEQVAGVRQFSRFYTQKLEILGEGLLHSPFSLTQARVIYELFARGRSTAAELSQDLGLDPGYLSRTLSGLQEKGLLERTASLVDARQMILSLTPQGRAAAQELDAGSVRRVSALLQGLSAAERAELSHALRRAQTLLGAALPQAGAVRLRPHGVGDLGWVIQRHGELYAQEYGWDIRFEALVARIVGDLQESFDPQWERGWIAEQDGRRLGSVFVVKQDERVAKLRLLLLEPAARGQGVGLRLVEECLRFAREAGYAKITLWTHSILTAARAIYARTGFERVHQEPMTAFGQQLNSETWERVL